MEETLNAEILKAYPEQPDGQVLRELEKAITGNPCKILVLDDDPTGIQTVHQVPVYTDWEEETIRQGFLQKSKVFYILTDSRSFTEGKTREVHKKIGALAEKISEELQIPYFIISRSDSTLRGHYPLETECLREEIEKHGKKIDGEILCFFFKEGERYTIGDIHYVMVKNKLVPAGRTEFAGDKTFGYQSSNLCEYVEEKTKGAYPASQVRTIDLEELKRGDVNLVQKKLEELQDFQKIIVNAVSYRDLQVFALAFYQAVEKGKHYILRTASSMVKELAGVKSRPLLTKEELIREDSRVGGIVVVGSHTAKTTEQLERLREVKGLKFIEFNSDYVLDEKRFRDEIRRVQEENNHWISRGNTVVNYTKRKVLVLENDTREEALIRSTKISDAVQSLVGGLKVKPAFVVAKGGITSSDVGTKALKVKKAMAMGQIQPGVPVWETGEESRFPGIPYVIFPGNVGKEDTLKKVVEELVI